MAWKQIPGQNFSCVEEFHLSQWAQNPQALVYLPQYGLYPRFIGVDVLLAGP
jgi:hypothetical protein